MKHLTCTLLASVALVRIATAAETLTPPPSAANAPAPETAALELKAKSSFSLDEAGRNPFWPIGWKPAPKVTNQGTSEHVGPEISSDVFTVSSITVDSTGRYAIVNGKVMTEGQVFGLQMGNQTYQISVKAIQDGQVVLLRRDQEITVPLRRR